MILICDLSFEFLTVSMFGTGRSVPETHQIEMSPNSKELAVGLKNCVSGREPGSIALRVPFGGEKFGESAPLNIDSLSLLEELNLAHPAHAALVQCSARALRAAFPNAGITAYFEDTFFNRLPESEKRYAVPFRDPEEKAIRRPGFHGIFHSYVSRKLPKSKRIISIVFDRQPTVCSIQNGDPVSISLGHTPLEGIMGERNCGDIDPGILFVLMKRHGFSIRKMDSILKHESGFFGMTGYNLTIPKLAELYGKDLKVDRAFQVFQNHILRYLGEGLALMDGCDAIVASGPYLEPLAPWFYRFLRNISFLGIHLAPLPWEKPEDSGMTTATAPDSKISVQLNFTPTASILFELQDHRKRKIPDSRKASLAG